MHSFFVSWIGITDILLTLPYSVAQREIFLDDFWLPFAWRTTIGSSVLVTCTSIVATVWCDISLISSALDPENTCMEAAHAWVFIVKSGGMRGVYLFSQIFIWWCFQLIPWRYPMIPSRHSSCREVKTFLSHTSASTYTLPHCRDISVLPLVHYHWAGCWFSRLLSVQRVGCFCPSFFLLCGRQSDCHIHQRKVSDCWKGRRRIRWRIGLLI